MSKIYKFPSIGALRDTINEVIHLCDKARKFFFAKLDEGYGL